MYLGTKIYIPPSVKYGTSGDDIIVGNVFTDTMYGYDGNDTMYGDSSGALSLAGRRRFTAAATTIFCTATPTLSPLPITGAMTTYMADGE
jgi:hypothetical protein